MNLQGERLIGATVPQTWAGLIDPETLRQCIAGCESMDPFGENQYRARLAVKVGPVSARFNGQLRLTDVLPLDSYKIEFEGQGGAAGFGKGEATVRLRAVNGGTVLAYEARAHVGGKLAQVGSRLVQSAASKVADDFFKAFESVVSAQHAEAHPSALVAEPRRIATCQPTHQAALPKWAMFAGLALACLAVWYAFRSMG